MIHRQPTNRLHTPIERYQRQHHLQQLMLGLRVIGTPAADGTSQPTAFANVKSVQPPSVPITSGATLHLHHQQPGVLDEHQIQFAPPAVQVLLLTGSEEIRFDQAEIALFSAALLICQAATQAWSLPSNFPDKPKRCRIRPICAGASGFPVLLSLPTPASASAMAL